MIMEGGCLLDTVLHEHEEGCDDLEVADGGRCDGVLAARCECAANHVASGDV